MNNNGGTYKLKNTNGPLLQLGTNIDLGSNRGFHLDYKQFFVKPKLQFQNYVVKYGGTGFTGSKSDSLNPAVVTVGLSYLF